LIRRKTALGSEIVLQSFSSLVLNHDKDLFLKGVVGIEFLKVSGSSEVAHQRSSE